MLSACSDAEAASGLAKAVAAQDVENIRFFASIGADLNRKDSVECTLLMDAANNGHYQAAEALLEAGADPNAIGSPSGWTAMHYAAYRGNAWMAELLLKYKADPEIKSQLGGATVLHTAAFNGTLDLVKTIVEAGADVFATNDRGNTAMQIAIFRSEEKLQLSGKPFVEVAEYLKQQMHEAALRANAVLAQKELVATDIARLKSLNPARFRIKPRQG
ncbi:MAG: ankyrin repeat domain-containing protein [Alphaproteobacteria bacterium]